jgi:hypothetical protein
MLWCIWLCGNDAVFIANPLISVKLYSEERICLEEAREDRLWPYGFVCS